MLLRFAPSQTSYQALDDFFLEPQDSAFLIHTRNYSHRGHRKWGETRIFEWLLGKPRVIHAQDDAIYGLTVHDGRLVYQHDDFGNSSIRELFTGKTVAHGYFEPLASHGGELYGVESTEARDLVDSVIRRIGREDAYHHNGPVYALASSGYGLMASLGSSSKPCGTHAIMNMHTLEQLASETVSEDDLEGFGYDHISFLGLSNGIDGFYFSRPSRHLGVYDAGNRRVAHFSQIDEMFMHYHSFRNRHGMHFESNSKARVAEIRELESFAQKHLGYDPAFGMTYAKRCGALRHIGAEELELDFVQHHLRAALKTFLYKNFSIAHTAVFNGHLLMASERKLYAVPLSRLPAQVSHRQSHVWTFRDNIEGLYILEGDEMRRVSGKANLKMGRRSFRVMRKAA